jgi:hypothetical protein
MCDRLPLADGAPRHSRFISAGGQKSLGARDRSVARLDRLLPRRRRITHSHRHGLSLPYLSFLLRKQREHSEPAAST